MNYLFLFIFGSYFFSSFCVYGAKIGFRFYHKHEYEELIAEPIDSFPVTHEFVSVIQFANNFTTIDVSKKVREKFKTNLLLEEAILFGPLSDAKKNSHCDLVKRIQEAEKAGWEWDHIIPYREPSFDFSIKAQDLSPGPWFDLRLISKNDIDNMRDKLSEAYKKKKLKKKKYLICPLIYSWKNIGEKEKMFLKENCDGVYIELNPRDGRWVTDGLPSIFKNNYKKDKQYTMANFGVPGTYDCAKMAKWCDENNLVFGITIGANVEDFWTLEMMADFAKQCENVGVDPRNENFVYLLHHNQGTPGLLPYFPESKSHSMTFLTRDLIENFGALSSKKLSLEQMSKLKVPRHYRLECMKDGHVSSVVIHVTKVNPNGSLQVNEANDKKVDKTIPFDKILTIRPARLKGKR